MKFEVTGMSRSGSRVEEAEEHIALVGGEVKQMEEQNCNNGGHQPWPGRRWRVVQHVVRRAMLINKPNKWF